MTAEDLVIARLTTEEGFRAAAYRDTVGALSIGYGFNVDAGISEPAARALLTAQVDERMLDLMVYPWYTALDEVRQSVCLDLAYNLGEHGFMEFQHLIGALSIQNWQGAHDALLDSDAARALPSRYEPLAQLLLTGVA